MPPAIIAAVVAVGATAAASFGVIAMSTAVIIGTLATVAGTLLTKTSVPSIGNYTSQQERKQVLRSSAAACSYVYGRTITSGLLQFAEEQRGDQDEDEWIHIVIVLASHPIDAVEQVWLGDDPIGMFGSNATWALINDPTVADPFLLANCPSWKTDMVGKGLAILRVSLKFDQDLFPSGIPNIKARIRGKRIYDPRTGRTEWSDNAALVIRDFYLSDMLEVAPDDIDEPMFLEAANICDQSVVNGDGSIVKRYTLNGQFDADEAISSILDDMHECCGGEPTYMAGKHGILVGAYYGPATMVLDESMIISDLNIVPESSFTEKVNIVSGTFVDAKDGYQEADFPTVKVREWIDEDGNEFSQDKKFRFVDNEWQAQRLAQIVLNKKRLGRTITLTVNYAGYSMRPGYYVRLTVAVLGIVDQEFRITSWELSGTDGVNLSLRQETAEVWNDAVGKPIDRPDISVLPPASVVPPWNLNYETIEISDVVQGQLTWQNSASTIYNKVIVRLSGSIVMTVQVPGQSVRLNGLLKGDYDIGVIAVDARGAQSNEVSIAVSIRAPNPPSGADITQQYFGFTIKPRTTDAFNVSTQYDFWTSGINPLPDTLTTTVESLATRRGQGQLITDSGLLNDVTYYWYIRTMNAYGSSDFIEIAALCHTDTAGLLEYIDGAIRDSGAFEGLQKGIDTNLEGILANALANNDTVTRQYRQQGEISANVMTIATTVVGQNEAIAELQDLVLVELGPDGSLQAAINQKLTAVITDDSAASATYLLNLMVKRFGEEYNAGFGISIDDVGGGVYKSTVVFDADRFAIYNNDNMGNKVNVFYTFDGQAFLDAVFIRNGTIDMLKIADVLQSSNYVAGLSGWRITKDGEFEINGTNGNGRVNITNEGVHVYDNNDVLRVELGLFTA